MPIRGRTSYQVLPLWTFNGEEKVRGMHQYVGKEYRVTLAVQNLEQLQFSPLCHLLNWLLIRPTQHLEGFE